jgi:hypothetical protein
LRLHSNFVKFVNCGFKKILLPEIFTINVTKASALSSPTQTMAFTPRGSGRGGFRGGDRGGRGYPPAPHLTRSELISVAVVEEEAVFEADGEEDGEGPLDEAACEEVLGAAHVAVEVVPGAAQKSLLNLIDIQVRSPPAYFC